MLNYFIYKIFEPMSVFILIILLVSIMNQSNQLYIGCLTAVRYLSKITNRVGIIMTTLLIVGLIPIRNKALIGAPIMKEIGMMVNMKKFNNASVSFFGGHMHYMTSPLSSSLALIMTMGAVSFPDLLFKGGLWIPAVIWGILAMVQIRFNKDGDFIEFVKINFKMNNIPIRGLLGLLPIVTIFILTLIFNLHFRTAVLSAIAVSIIVYLFNRKIDNINFPSISIKDIFLSMDWKLIFIIFSILNISTAINEFGGIADRIPHTSILLYAFLIGIICGSSSMTVAIAMGIFGSIVIGNPALVAQMYLSCFLGYILSPVHRCIFINAKIFEQNLLKLYIMNIIICIIVGGLGFLALSFFAPLI